MNYPEEADDAQEEAGGACFFIEDYNSSENEENVHIGSPKHKSSKQTAHLSGESSPQLILAFPISAKPEKEGRWASTDELQAQEEEDSDCDLPIEDWMLLGGEEQEEDSRIQLNLSYWSSSDDNSGDQDGSSVPCPVTDSWAVSDRDKYGAVQSLTSRYFVPGYVSLCHICNRTGHSAKSCYFHKKSPVCVLCGIRGHVQKNCPGRPCSSCGLPSHGPGPCRVPPVWRQYCHRCQMTGHLSDACPDIWRQYHMTIRLEVPIKPRSDCCLKHKGRRAHCYNCSKRGHYGYECTRRRMVSGTFAVLPYVSQYDTLEDVLQCGSSMQTGAMANRRYKLASVGSFPPSDQEHLYEITRESGEEKASIHESGRTKQQASSQADRRKTWPERRRERRAVKQLRREAQAMREGGRLGRSCCNSDEESCPEDPFRKVFHGHRRSIPPPEKKRRDNTTGRKSREAERWRKRGGTKRGELHAHGNMDIGSENLLSPKQRVRHRRR
ncbi:uncharacterized protein ACNS7B_012007 isoform 2-T2 [Menidia menidia]